MPVSFIPSAEQMVDRQKSTARKRRRNQNVEIDELAALLPFNAFSPAPNPQNGGQLVPVSKQQSIDKISVLRLAATYLKLQNFIQGANSQKKTRIGSKGVTSDLISEALDGFLIVLDKDGNILFASKSIVNYVGLTQQDVIGQNLTDITHPDNADSIAENLQPNTSLVTNTDGQSQESQFREFYVRFKSTVTSGRMQLSRFSSHMMVQITGNLKVKIPDANSDTVDGTIKLDEQVKPEVFGFVGECRLIESTSSVLELSIPQSYFTTTVSLDDMKIISVEASISKVIGFDPGDFVGTKLLDYFHPADYQKMIPCEKLLLHTGHAVSPVFRFMNSSGGWVWMQLEGTLRYKLGGTIPLFWEVKAKMISQEEGKLKFIEQKEVYVKDRDPNQDILCPHKDKAFIDLLRDPTRHCQENSPEAVIETLKKANIPVSVVDSVLHGRELALRELPRTLKRCLTEDRADEFVSNRNKSWGLSPSWSPESASPSTIAKLLESQEQGGRVNTTEVDSSPQPSSNSLPSVSSSISSPPSSISTQSIESALSPQSLTNVASPNSPFLQQQIQQQLKQQQQQQQLASRSSSSSLPYNVTSPHQFSPQQQFNATSPNQPLSISSPPSVLVQQLPQPSPLNTTSLHTQFTPSPPAPVVTTVWGSYSQNDNSDLSTVFSPELLQQIVSPGSIPIQSPSMQQQSPLSNSVISSTQSVGSPSVINGCTTSVSSPGSVFSPESVTMLHSMGSTDSIPGLSPVPFQNSQSGTPSPYGQIHAPSQQIPIPTSNMDSIQPSLLTGYTGGDNQLAIMTDSGVNGFGMGDPVLEQLLSEAIVLNSASYGTAHTQPHANTVTTGAPFSQNVDANGTLFAQQQNGNTNGGNALKHDNSVPQCMSTNNTIAVSCDVNVESATNGSSSSAMFYPGTMQQNGVADSEVQDIIEQFM